MVGGRCYGIFMHSIVLLLWVCLHYVEASSGKHIIHRKVGETVELSPGLPTECVTAATWKYGGITVAGKDVGVSKKSPFKDRSELNLTDFTLTVRKLILQDSGDFIFVSDVNYEHRPAVTITLQVHEDSLSSSLLMYIAGLFTGVLITVLFLFLLYCIKSKGLCRKRLKQSETINQEENQQHVYSALSHGDLCVYETMRPVKMLDQILKPKLLAESKKQNHDSRT
ncbi:uncharacterized protein LOC102082939 isoform X2 [Oreochromis niloticus]|uniref:uncharacterized protein LOC102082939 isoform X2 n=1 Tax=Oreochromis niloticus TaxID=8128 RepID=UPI0009056F62|nr:uncharacterized protein LOC102082939 isoform X2 [Oreochromis niloticus]